MQGYTPLSKIKLNPANPRLIRDERYNKLVSSVAQFPKMLDKRGLVVDGTKMILGGNQRWRAILDILKMPEAELLEILEGRTVEFTLWEVLRQKKAIPENWIVDGSDFTDEEIRRFIIADNVEFGEHDWDVLANEWDADELEGWGVVVPDFSRKQGAQEDDYEIPDEIETDIVAGDLFEIGPHRLLCGDSTKKEDVQMLLGGKEPYLMVTDPPYGVGYDANWRNEADRADGRPVGARATGKVTNDHKVDWFEAYNLSPAKVSYVWHADRHASEVQNSIEKAGFVVRCQIVWVKNNIVISRGDYHWKHEPCWYAVKKGSKGNWASDRKQTTVWEINKPMKSETGHSTQKPVECMARPIGNHDGDVHDPFLGSGTTMVAAHQLGRKCYGMEIEPKYCQVVIDRMIKLDPELEIKKNGQPYFVAETVL